MPTPILRGLLPCLSTLLLAQAGQAQSGAGVGSSLLTVDLEAVTGESTLLGVAFVGGKYYVSGRNGSPTATHNIYELDKAFQLVQSYAQSQPHQSSSWGVRDMATDGISLIGGSEAGFTVWDPATGAPVGSVQAQNGPTAVAPLTGGAALSAIGVFRGMAFDPSGDGGSGSLWVADFGDDILEIDLQGNILNTLGAGPIQNTWSVYGLAFDPVAGSLWANADGFGGGIAEIDGATGAFTGARFAQPIPAGLQGGLSFVNDSVPTTQPLPYEPATSFVAVSQGGNGQLDTLGLHRKDLYAGLPSSEESWLGIARDSDPLSRADTTFDVGTTLTARTSANGSGSNAGLFSLLIFNFNADAQVQASTDGGFLGATGAIPELVAVNPQSTPGPTGPLAYQLVTAAVGAPVSFTIPGNFPFSAGDAIRVQSLFAEPASSYLGLMASNEARFIADPQPAVLVQAVGTNSFNSDTSSGFWSITQTRGADIVEVEFDFSANPAINQVFDTDQVGMADRFDGGNGVSPCQGTYRNGSDGVVGLIYDGANTISLCSPGSNTGWIGSNQTVPGSYQTIRFRFAPGAFAGATFEFDADTDGSGVSGAAMAGMDVRVTLSDGTVYQGAMTADQTGSSVGFF